MKYVGVVTDCSWYQGKEDRNEERDFQKRRVYGDEIPLFNRDEYEKVKAIKKRLINFPKTRIEILIFGLIQYITDKSLIEEM